MLDKKKCTCGNPNLKTVKPVIQTHRRIPVSLEEKIHKQIKGLLESDIVEKVYEPSLWVSLIVPNKIIEMCAFVLV